jgi:outer membrane protein OmpA-like peptidoglycan-associated protein
MKRLSLLFSILLVAWITLASYWYVCNIRKHCGDQVRTAVSEMPDTPTTVDTDSLSRVPSTADSVAMALEYLNSAGTKKYYFEFASVELNTADDEEDYFRSLSFFLANKDGSSVSVEGHACSRGTPQANERFSKMRAEKVGKHLVEKGIMEDRINLSWKGDREPAASNDTEDGRKLNRRAEITIHQ